MSSFSFFFPLSVIAVKVINAQCKWIMFCVTQYPTVHSVSPQSARNPGISSSPGSPPPPWLRKACSHLLLRLVKGTEGILHLYAAMSAGKGWSVWVHGSHRVCHRCLDFNIPSALNGLSCVRAIPFWIHSKHRTCTW